MPASAAKGEDAAGPSERSKQTSSGSRGGNAGPAAVHERQGAGEPSKGSPIDEKSATQCTRSLRTGGTEPRNVCIYVIVQSVLLGFVPSVCQLDYSFMTIIIV